VVAALGVRLLLLALRGDYIVYDEGYYLLLSRSLAAGDGYSLNGLRHVALSPLQPLLVAAVSLLGIPDLWASRLLAAVAGALLCIPVASLARRVGGERAALPAALVTALAPALLSFTPFFPGTSWNLYFGTEPLFLLLAFGAAALAAGSADDGRARSFVAAGAACGLAFLARAEGLIVAPLTLALLAGRLLSAPGRRLRPVVLAVLAGLLIAAPYLVYLRTALGRWALSGRVQMRGAGQALVPTASQRGGSVLEAFVWGGESEGFRRELYGLNAAGTGMQSQYWGIPKAVERAAPESTAAAPVPVAPGPALAPAPAPGTPDDPAAGSPRTGTLLRGMGVLMPWWLAAAGIAGLLASVRAVWQVAWTLPPLAAALIPALVVYVEPRSMLPLVPVAAIGCGALWSRVAGALESAGTRGVGLRFLVGVMVPIALVAPAIRDGWRSRSGNTPLQQVARAQRAVGQLLGDSLPAGATIMSWHPAPAIWAHREWRVLPWEPLERILPYAVAEGVGALVLSRFHPGPVAELPRAFTVVLLDSAALLPVGSLELQRVFETPLVLVGRPGAVPR
jgi:4-amino-4-deoxy-L-arabinose transferase-like glycosyltransferase